MLKYDLETKIVSVWYLWIRAVEEFDYIWVIGWVTVEHSDGGYAGLLNELLQSIRTKVLQAKTKHQVCQTDSKLNPFSLMKKSIRL